MVFCIWRELTPLFFVISISVLSCIKPSVQSIDSDCQVIEIKQDCHIHFCDKMRLWEGIVNNGGVEETVRRSIRSTEILIAEKDRLDSLGYPLGLIDEVVCIHYGWSQGHESISICSRGHANGATRSVEVTQLVKSKDGQAWKVDMSDSFSRMGMICPENNKFYSVKMEWESPDVLKVSTLNVSTREAREYYMVIIGKELGFVDSDCTKYWRKFGREVYNVIGMNSKNEK